MKDATIKNVIHRAKNLEKLILMIRRI